MSGRRNKGLKTYLKNHPQRDVAEAFGRTQSWVSQILSAHPNAVLTLEGDEIMEMKFTQVKVHKSKKALQQE